MKSIIPFSLCLLGCALMSAFGQSSTPPMVVVQAANAPAAAAPAVTAKAQDPGAVAAALKALDEIKAANAQTLQKQQAALEQLDELQKAADQLRIFAHRSGG